MQGRARNAGSSSPDLGGVHRECSVSIELGRRRRPGNCAAGLLVSALAQIALWAGAFVLCGDFAGFEDAFYHPVVNFTTLGYGDIVMSRRWRLLGPLEAVNGNLMLGLSAAMLFTVLGRVAEARAPRNDGLISGL